jgi:hypothetical protein
MELDEAPGLAPGSSRKLDEAPGLALLRLSLCSIASESEGRGRGTQVVIFVH